MVPFSLPSEDPTSPQPLDGPQSRLPNEPQSPGEPSSPTSEVDPLAAITANGGITELPGDFDAVDGGWKSVQSGDEFTRLYLDSKQWERVTPAIVERHKSLLLDFWGKKLTAMSQGANKNQIIKKFGGPDASENKLKSYPDRITEAARQLGTEDGIAATGRRQNLLRIADARTRLEGSLSTISVDGLVTPDEADLFLKLGRHEGLTTEEARQVLLDHLHAAGFEPVESIAPGSAHPFSVKWHGAATGDLGRLIEKLRRNAAAHADNGDLESAVAAMTLAIDRVGTRAELFLTRAGYYKRLKDYAKALADCSKAVALAPDEAEPYITRARIHSMAGKSKEAIDDCTLALGVDMTSVLALSERARLRVATGDPQGAVADHRRALKLPRPADPESLVTLASCAMGVDEFTEAIELSNRALEIQPDARGFWYRGAAKYRVGDTDGAIADFSDAIRLNPKDASAFSVRARARAKKRDLDGAIEDFSQAIQLRPEETSVYLDRAHARLESGNSLGAVQDTGTVLARDPRNVDALVLRAQARTARREFSDSLADWREAARLRPKNASIKASLEAAAKRQAGAATIETPQEPSPPPPVAAEQKAVSQIAPLDEPMPMFVTVGVGALLGCVSALLVRFIISVLDPGFSGWVVSTSAASSVGGGGFFLGAVLIAAFVIWYRRRKRRHAN